MFGHVAYHIVKANIVPRDAKMTTTSSFRDRNNRLEKAKVCREKPGFSCRECNREFGQGQSKTYLHGDGGGRMCDSCYQRVLHQMDIEGYE